VVVDVGSDRVSSVPRANIRIFREREMTVVDLRRGSRFQTPLSANYFSHLVSGSCGGYGFPGRET